MGCMEMLQDLWAKGWRDHNPVLIHEYPVLDVNGLSKWSESCKFWVGLVRLLVIIFDNTKETTQ